MGGSIFGVLFRVSTFGESHGPAVGVVIDGCPAGLELDLEIVRRDLARRRPGQSNLTTRRDEADDPRILSGVFEGRTTGAPIAALVVQEDAKPGDYDHLAMAFRPSHADRAVHLKFGLRDHRGGGRSSARETVARVLAGSIARQVLSEQGVDVLAWTDEVAGIASSPTAAPRCLQDVEASSSQCPDPVAAAAISEAILAAKKAGDSVGGIVRGRVRGCLPGLGEPVFDRLHADLAKAMLSIPAARGFEVGLGFAAARLKGSEHNDQFERGSDGKARPSTNRAGGVLGGISTGEDIDFRVAFKPTATIVRTQVGSTGDGELIELPGRGRHDPCVVPRAVPIVEAMAALVVVDHLLRARASRLRGAPWEDNSP